MRKKKISENLRKSREKSFFTHKKIRKEKKSETKIKSHRNI